MRLPFSLNGASPHYQIIKLSNYQIISSTVNPPPRVRENKPQKAYFPFRSQGHGKLLRNRLQIFYNCLQKRNTILPVIFFHGGFRLARYDHV